MWILDSRRRISRQSDERNFFEFVIEQEKRGMMNLKSSFFYETKVLLNTNMGPR